MANNYTQATVNTLLPLLPHHHCLLRMLGDLDWGEYPDGVGTQNGRLVVEPDKLKAWADEGYVSAEFSQEAVDLAVAGMLEIYGETGLEVSGNSLSCVEWRDRDELGRRVWYLYCEESLDEWVERYLNWAIQSLPEDIKYIEVEFASFCDKMRRGEFGGGAWLITRGENRFMFTGSWLDAQKRELFGEEP